MQNNKKSFKDILSSRKVRYGSLSVVFTAVTLAFIIGINLIISALNASHAFTIDLTEEEFYTISEQTEKHFEELGTDFDITVYFCSPKDTLEAYSGTTYSKVRMGHELVLAFSEKFPDNIKVEYFDITADPQYVDKIAHLTQTTLNSDNIIVEGKYHTRVLNFDAFFQVAESDGTLWGFNGEFRMASAITQCSIKEKYSVLFTKGHGEGNTDALKTVFTDLGLDVADIDLSASTKEDIEKAFENARIMVIYDPQKDLVGYDAANPNAGDETDIINNFVNGNRSLMVFVDDSTPSLPNLQGYLSDVWGLSYETNNHLSDTEHSLGLDKNLLLGKFSGTQGSMAAQIHASFAADSDAKILFDNAVKISINKANNGATSEAGFTTFETATDKSEEKGEYPLFAVSTLMQYDDNNAKLYKYVTLCGSTSFASANRLLPQFGNREIIEAASRMMVTERVAPDIDSKPFAETALALETGDAKTLSVIVIAVAPLIIFVVGVAVHFKRRHL